MSTDKEVKSEFRIKASKEPDKYYATSVLKEEGFTRKQCKKCSKYFWSTQNDERCGDPACSGGFKFIGNTPAKNKMDYIDVWKTFSKLFKKKGYTPIDRYPVVARWRDDTDFVQASIYDFQPYVVSGEVEAPANPLVVPQFCLRFNDIDNVGITGAHYTGFVMIGQHAFMPPEKWDQAKYFGDIHSWLKDGLRLPNSEIKFHEDAWAGGGNFGPCMEFFSRGLELGNQVYMMYEQTPQGSKPLNLKVLDMGMGHERNAWFTKGLETSYESTFPTVINKLFDITGLKKDNIVLQKFLPYASYLNADEAANIDLVWEQISGKIQVDVAELKQKIIPLSALYSVAEHSRSLLVAISDGALPSNIAGGYNLRVILRRALSFISKYRWNIDLNEMCEMHAKYLKPLFPELSENLEDVKKILAVEKNKYAATNQKTAQIVEKIATKKVDEKDFLQLYDSQGITPEQIKEEMRKHNIETKIPQDFYKKVAELHETHVKEAVKEVKGKVQIKRPPSTEILYYDDPVVISFEAKVLNIINDKQVILDKTAFYPESGGQESDKGLINNIEVINVKKVGKVIIHELKDAPNFNEDDKVECKINLIRRNQLTKHHTATHIINSAARTILGNHINQAGAYKGEDKARLDITHYENLTDEEVKQIEELANKIVKKGIDVSKEILSRNDAEKKYGMRIYQGGAVPGKSIRIVEIHDIDIEACGGTHLNNTKDVGQIRILKTSKIQDGVVRIEFAVGEAATKYVAEESAILDKLSELLNVKKSEVPSKAEELFKKWKLARKVVKNEKKIDIKLIELNESPKAENLSDENLIKKTAEIYGTQPEHLPNTVRRFLEELEEYKQKLR